MNSKHLKTLQAIFAKPTVGSLRFADIESLLLALGAELVEREGSRIKDVARRRMARTSTSSRQGSQEIPSGTGAGVI